MGTHSPFDIAVLYAELGNKDQAFAWLDTAYRERDFRLISLKTNFALDADYIPIHGSPSW